MARRLHVCVSARDESRWIVPFESSCIVILIAVVGLYFVGYRHGTPPNPGVFPTMVMAARLIGMSLGQVGAGTGKVFPEAFIGVLFCGIGCLLWASGIIPVSRGLRGICSVERSRAFGLVMFAAGMAALILVTAWGRAGWVPFLLYGMQSPYALLSVPGLCAVYFAWILYGRGIAGNLIGTVFAIVVILALPFNVRKGLAQRDAYVAGMHAFEQNLANGLSWRELGERHQKFLMDWDHISVMEVLRCYTRLRWARAKAHSGEAISAPTI
jgi:hypothetical protein